jgi:putative membrane protein
MEVRRSKVVIWGGIALLVIMHLVGLVGLHSSHADSFAALTPVNLLVAFLAITPFYTSAWKNLLSFFLVAFLIGMLVEIVGVQTGYPFGTYHYTSILGLSVAGVPLMIGLNWFLLAAGILSGVNCILHSASIFFKSFCSAFLMTSLDFLIEPFAIKYRLWVWESSAVPIQNYLAWFFISFLIFLLGFQLLPKEKNKVAGWLIVIFYMFFGLNLLL